MTDPFLDLIAKNSSSPLKNHSERKHSKFAASASERWLNCSGSVELCEGLPEKSSIWAEEGTRAHECLEDFLTQLIKGGNIYLESASFPRDMKDHCRKAAIFIYTLYLSLPDAEILVETRIFLDFIHKEMFGTFDSGIIDLFGTLHVIDFKFGAGIPVSVKENLQMIFYAIGLAHRYKWNFKRVRMWIIQPRIKGYDGPTFWEITTEELMGYIEIFQAGVKRVENTPIFKEGSWCHWCKAKSICPLKQKGKLEKAEKVFG